MVPEVRAKLKETSSFPYEVAIVGIETHICVTQTALDLLADGHKVYVLADGVSSCHEGERGIALDRLSKDGATVTTSESFLYVPLGASAPSSVPFPKYASGVGRVVTGRLPRYFAAQEPSIDKVMLSCTCL